MNKIAVDRTGWKSGPWDNEPDEMAVQVCGFHGLIRRGVTGALCGYLHIPEGHPWYGLGYDDIDADVHGGLTYARKDSLRPGVWVIGFDCNHAGDYTPYDTKHGFKLYEGESYKDLLYVHMELADLAEQAKEAEK